MKQISFLKVFVLVAVLFTAMLKVSAQQIDIRESDNSINFYSYNNNSMMKIYSQGEVMINKSSAAPGTAFTVNVDSNGAKAICVKKNWLGNIFDVFGSGTVRVQGLAIQSDSILKKDIYELDSQIGNLKKLKGVSYHWKDKEKQGGKKCYGLLAQNIAKVYPDMVFQPDSGEMAIYYTELIPVLLQVTQEQQDIIEEQAKMLFDIEKRLLKLEKSKK